MSDTQSTVTIRVGSSADLSALKATQAQLQAIQSVTTTLQAALGTLGVGFSLTGVVEGIKASLAYAASLGHLAEQAGISVESLQRLNFAAIDAGLSTDTLATALEMLRKNLAAAAALSPKQVDAIADLKLDLAELLAMPQEQRIEAVATAYMHAENRARAWNDVVVLLGRSSSHLQEIFEQLGTTGLAGIKTGAMISGDDVKNSELFESHVKRTWISFEAMLAHLFTGPSMSDQLKAMAGEPLWGDKGFAAGGGGFGGHGAGGTWDDAAVAKTRAQLQATLEATPQMLAAHLGLTRALESESNAYQTLAERADLARAQAADYEAQAAKIKATGDPYSVQQQSEALRLETEASKLRAQANKDDALAAKESEAARTRAGERGIEMLARMDQAQQRQAAIAIAAMEHDWTKTDNEKWQEKVDILTQAIADQKEYIRQQQAIADNATLPQAVRDRAAGKIESGQTKLASDQGQLTGMGPSPTSFAQNLSAGLTHLKSQWGSLQQQMAGGMSGAVSSGMQSVETHLEGIVRHTESWRQGIQGIARDIGTTLLQTLIQIGVQQLANYAVSKIFKAGEDKDTKTSTTEKALEGGMKSIAQLGPIWGPLAFAASLAAIMALVGGFEEGGYTGATGGQVHPHEYVFSAPAVRAIGVGNLERAHQAAVSGPGGASSAGGKPMRFIHVLSNDLVGAKQLARDPAFDNVMLDWARRRRGEIIET